MVVHLPRGLQLRIEMSAATRVVIYFQVYNCAVSCSLARQLLAAHVAPIRHHTHRRVDRVSPPPQHWRFTRAVLSSTRLVPRQGRQIARLRRTAVFVRRVRSENLLGLIAAASLG